jgi:hypothetical protein
MEPIGSLLLSVLCVYAVIRLASPVVRSLLKRPLRRALTRIDAATGDQPDTRRALREQVDHTPGTLLKLLVARALLKSVREPRSERLAGLFFALGAAVIGGTLGQDYKKEWTGDLRQGRIEGQVSAVLLANAVSCFLSSPQIRWVRKVDPGLRRRFARQYEIGGLLMEAAARSRLSALVMIAVPGAAILAFAGYAIGYITGFDALGWALVALAITDVPHRTVRWQRERQLASDIRKTEGT